MEKHQPGPENESEAIAPLPQVTQLQVERARSRSERVSDHASRLIHVLGVARLLQEDRLEDYPVVVRAVKKDISEKVLLLYRTGRALQDSNPRLMRKIFKDLLGESIADLETSDLERASVLKEFVVNCGLFHAGDFDNLETDGSNSSEDGLCSTVHSTLSEVSCEARTTSEVESIPNLANVLPQEGCSEEQSKVPSRSESHVPKTENASVGRNDGVEHSNHPVPRSRDSSEQPQRLSPLALIPSKRKISVEHPETPPHAVVTKKVTDEYIVSDVIAALIRSTEREGINKNEEFNLTRSYVLKAGPIESENDAHELVAGPIESENDAHELVAGPSTSGIEKYVKTFAGGESSSNSSSSDSGNKKLLELSIGCIEVSEMSDSSSNSSGHDVNNPVFSKKDLLHMQNWEEQTLIDYYVHKKYQYTEPEVMYILLCKLLNEKISYVRKYDGEEANRLVHLAEAYDIYPGGKLETGNDLKKSSETANTMEDKLQTTGNECASLNMQAEDMALEQSIDSGASDRKQSVDKSSGSENIEETGQNQSDDSGTRDCKQFEGDHKKSVESEASGCAQARLHSKDQSDGSTHEQSGVIESSGHEQAGYIDRDQADFSAYEQTDKSEEGGSKQSVAVEQAEDTGREKSGDNVTKAPEQRDSYRKQSKNSVKSGHKKAFENPCRQS